MLTRLTRAVMLTGRVLRETVAATTDVSIPPAVRANQKGPLLDGTALEGVHWHPTKITSRSVSRLVDICLVKETLCRNRNRRKDSLTDIRLRLDVRQQPWPFLGCSGKSKRKRSIFGTAAMKLVRPAVQQHQATRQTQTRCFARSKRYDLPSLPLFQGKLSNPLQDF